MKIKKDERGSVTLFVLITCIFMITILLMINMSVMNKNKSQKRDLEEIAKEYGQNKAGLDEAYAKATNTIKYVAQIGNIKYETLREAIEAVKTDETILMIGDTTENNTVPEDKKFTLDLGEQTITGGIVNNGEMIIKGNGSIIKNEAGNVLENNGILTVEGGNYIKSGETGRVIKNYEKATINAGIFNNVTTGHTVENLGMFYFNGGKIILDYAGTSTALYNASGTIEMTNGEIFSKVHGLCVNEGSFKSTGGKIQKSGTTGSSAVLVRNTGSAYLYNTFVTAGSPSAVKLLNQTTKYNNLIYIYTEDMKDYLNNVEGYNDGKVFMAEFSNDGDTNVTYYNSGHSTGSLAVWTTKDSQDDLEWISPYSVQNQDLNFVFNKTNHKGESGVYRLHLYTNGTSTFIEGIDIDVPETP